MIRHDGISFPGLKSAMDIKTMTESLQQVLKKDNPRLGIVDGRIGDVRYDENKQQYSRRRCRFRIWDD